MTEGGPDKEPQDHSPIDEFEIAGRTWAAQDRILAELLRLEKGHGLEPVLRENVHEAFLEGDNDAYNLALAEFLEALREAREW